MSAGANAATDVGVIGWRCAVCGADVDIATPLTFRCPNASDDDHRHALRLVQRDAPATVDVADPNPFIAYRTHFAWDSHAASVGLDDAQRLALVRELDDRVRAVDGVGFTITPLRRADALSDALGFTVDGGVWVKDETGQVAGSHKARHLFTTLLHLIVTERAGLAPWTATARPSLAIASCGNAALAAATLAAAVEWPLDVFVPADANPVVVRLLDDLGARVTTCHRRAGDPPGDPCVTAFRAAVRAGSIPFSVHGPENAWCLDGGRTIGWELADAAAQHLFVQVGGGALARCAIGGLGQVGGGVELPRLHAVQTEACAPLARAWKRAVSSSGGPADAPRRWAEWMTPWEDVGRSAADGILDDETYDWLGVVNGMAATHGAPVIAKEAEVGEAWRLAREHTDIDVSATGSAGLAGLLAIRDMISNHERVAVIFSGRHR